MEKLENYEIVKKINEYSNDSWERIIERINFYNKILGKKEYEYNDFLNDIHSFDDVDNKVLNVLFNLYCHVTQDEEEKILDELEIECGYDKAYKKWSAEEEKKESEIKKQNDRMMFYGRNLLPLVKSLWKFNRTDHNTVIEKVNEFLVEKGMLKTDIYFDKFPYRQTSIELMKEIMSYIEDISKNFKSIYDEIQEANIEEKTEFVDIINKEIKYTNEISLKSDINPISSFDEIEKIGPYILKLAYQKYLAEIVDRGKE